MFFDEVVSLFTDINAITIILLVAGFIFVIIEMLAPGIIVFGVLGVLSLIAGIVVHAIVNGSIIQLVMLVLIVILLLLLVFFIIVSSAKRGLLSRSPLILKETAVPTTYLEKTQKELQKLVGQKGICISKVNPCGLLLIDKNEYEVFSHDGVILKNSYAEVIKIDDMKIIVKKC